VTAPGDSASARSRRLAAIFPGHSEVAVLLRSHDWSSTSLGQPEEWPQSLRTMVSMMLTSRYQMWMGWGPDLNFFYNDAYRPTLGAKHPASLAAPTRQLWSEIWEEIAPRIQQVLHTGEATWDEGLLLMLERNGYTEETYHTFSYSPVFTDDGAIGGMLSVVAEETERVVSERRLALVRELSSRLAVAKTTSDVMAAVQDAWPVAERDLPFTLTYLFDDAMRRGTLAARTGISAEHPAAAPEIDLMAPGIWPIAEVLAGNDAIVLDPLPSGYTWPAGPWQRPPSRAILTPIAQQAQPEPAGVVISGVNPHRPCDDGYRSFVNLFVGQIAAGLASARAYERERQRAEALAELDRAKTVFFSNVSHELRTPLTLMLGPLDDLTARADLDGGVQAQLALMRRNGARLLRLVNTLLDFSRIEAGRARARFEPVDLSEYTRDLAGIFGAATERAGLELVIDTPAMGEPVYVDRAMWENVVLNLVSNAFKYTLSGSIEVSLRRAGTERVELVVRDSGIGIPADQLPHLFERFHRIEGAQGRSHEGTGIGLALVRELVKLHGGVVQVESVVGRGSRFTVTLPLGRAHLPPEQVFDAAAAPASTAASLIVEEALQWLTPAGSAPGAEALATGTPDLPSSPGERILVVDDSADMRDYICRLLRPRWQVQAVGNGDDALAAIRHERPHLVITDIMMPGLDGFGLLHALRRDPDTRELPVLVLSARAGDEARMEGIEAGANDYLVKPFSGRELLARVEAQLLRERVRAVEEAHARRIAAVFAQAPVAIAITRGRDHVFEMANDPYQRIVGGRTVVGLPLREALPELASQGIPELFDRIYQTGEPYTARSQPIDLRTGGDGQLEQHHFDLVFQPLVDDAGRVEGIAAVGFDVTDLARARLQAEIANRAKDEFLAMLGHELRNPLAPILTALQLLRLRGVQGGEREREIIERQVQHLVTLVSDLLDVSRITRGKIQLTRRPVEVSEVVAKAIETASPLLEQKGHQLQVDVPRNGLAVDGDSDRLAQVAANLLTNAAKYTEDHGVIRITAGREGGEMVLRVRDSGIGISSDMLPRIFDLFVQERQALDRAQGGLGLGLAIVRSLIELHGGRVEARSDGAGRGAEFIVRLPIGAEAVRVPELPVAAAAAPAPMATARRILVVDDNTDAAEMLTQALTQYGHVVRAAGDGPTALRAAEEFRPDIALLDIGLPVMDGYELGRRFGAHPTLRGVRLIAVTGYGQEQDRRRSLASGFVAHMIKPIDLEQLRTAIEAAEAPDHRDPE
jgi:signal transduction histidine kinase